MDFLSLGLLVLGPLIGLPATCMSAASSRDTIDLSVRLGELQISISGPSGPATRLLQDITSRYSASGGRHSPRDSEQSFSLVPEEAFEERGSHVIERSLPVTRASIEEVFPELPDCLRVAGRRLGAASGLSGEERLERAWKAGCWAGAVLEGKIATPSRTPQIDLRPRVYVVLRSSTLSEPQCFASSNSYFKAVGNLRDGSSISHGWPSEVEAKAYCQAAGVVFPNVQP